jgi:hypothetical protein
LSFLAYVEQILLPTLAPGDIVIMENLGSHKRQAIPSGFSVTCVVIVLSGFPDKELFFLPTLVSRAEDMKSILHADTIRGGLGPSDRESRLPVPLAFVVISCLSALSWTVAILLALAIGSVF